MSMNQEQNVKPDVPCGLCGSTCCDDCLYKCGNCNKQMCENCKAYHGEIGWICKDCPT